MLIFTSDLLGMKVIITIKIKGWGGQGLEDRADKIFSLRDRLNVVIGSF